MRSAIACLLVWAGTLGAQPASQPEALNRLAEADRLWAAGKTAEAESIYNEVIAGNQGPTQSLARAQYGFQLSDAKRKAEAKRQFQAIDLRVVDQLPRAAQGNYRLILTRALSEVPERAAEVYGSYRQAIREHLDFEESVAGFLDAASTRKTLPPVDALEVAGTLMGERRPELAAPVFTAAIQMNSHLGAVDLTPLLNGLIDVTAARAIDLQTLPNSSVFSAGKQANNPWLSEAFRELHAALVDDAAPANSTGRGPLRLPEIRTQKELHAFFNGLFAQPQFSRASLATLLNRVGDAYFAGRRYPEALSRYTAAWLIDRRIEAALGMAAALAELPTGNTQRGSARALLYGEYVNHLSPDKVLHAVSSLAIVGQTKSEDTLLSLIRLYALLASSDEGMDRRQAKALAHRALETGAQVHRPVPELYATLGAVYTKLGMTEEAQQAKAKQDAEIAKLKAGEQEKTIPAIPTATSQGSATFAATLKYKEKAGFKVESSEVSAEGQTIRFTIEGAATSNPAVRVGDKAVHAKLSRADGGGFELSLVPALKAGASIEIQAGRAHLEGSMAAPIEWTGASPAAGSLILDGKVNVPVDLIRIEIKSALTPCSAARTQVINTYADPLSHRFFIFLAQPLLAGDLLTITSLTSRSQQNQLYSTTVRRIKTDIAGTHVYTRGNIGIGRRASIDVAIPTMVSLTADRGFHLSRSKGGCGFRPQIDVFASVLYGPPVVNGESAHVPGWEAGLYYPLWTKPSRISDSEEGRLFFGPVFRGGAQQTARPHPVYAGFGGRLGLLRLLDRVSGGSPDLLAYLDATVSHWNRYRGVDERMWRYELEGVYQSSTAPVMIGGSFSTGGGLRDWKFWLGYRLDLARFPHVF